MSVSLPPPVVESHPFPDPDPAGGGRYRTDIGHRVVLGVRRVGPGGQGVNVEYLLTALSKTKGFIH